jgi:DNA polymerase-3 subunit alpha
VEEAGEEALIEMAYARDLPLIATNPACFAERTFYAAHDHAVHRQFDACRQRRSPGPRRNGGSSRPIMEHLFSDVPEALANTLVVAQRTAFMPPKRKPILPSLAGDKEGEARMCAEIRAPAWSRGCAYYPEACHAELAQVLCAGPDVELAARFSAACRSGRVEEVLDYRAAGVRDRHHQPHGLWRYFLIVADFIKWAKEHDPGGAGRGSGAGSLVAWALTITDLDPIRLGLLFERFLNPERVSMPDFDIDFCETRRAK